MPEYQKTRRLPIIADSRRCVNDTHGTRDLTVTISRRQLPNGGNIPSNSFLALKLSEKSLDLASIDRPLSSPPPSQWYLLMNVASSLESCRTVLEWMPSVLSTQSKCRQWYPGSLRRKPLRGLWGSLLRADMHWAPTVCQATAPPDSGAQLDVEVPGLLFHSWQRSTQTNKGREPKVARGQHWTSLLCQGPRGAQHSWEVPHPVGRGSTLA